MLTVVPPDVEPGHSVCPHVSHGRRIGLPLLLGLSRADEILRLGVCEVSGSDDDLRFDSLDRARAEVLQVVNPPRILEFTYVDVAYLRKRTTK